MLAFAALAKLVLSDSLTDLSESLDSKISILGLLFNDFTFRAISKVKSFSRVPSEDVAPTSFPPWPASIIIVYLSKNFQMKNIWQ